MRDRETDLDAFSQTKSGTGPEAETHLGEEVQRDLCVPPRELHWPLGEAQQ